MSRKALNYSMIYDFYCGMIEFGDSIYFCSVLLFTGKNCFALAL